MGTSLASASDMFFGAARASRLESAAVVVTRGGKNASARSSSVRRRAISDARSSLLDAPTSRVVGGLMLLMADRLELEGAVRDVEMPTKTFAQPIEHLTGAALANAGIVNDDVR